MQPAAKFVERSVVIEAMPFDGTQESADQILDWMGARDSVACSGVRWSSGVIYIPTLEGEMMVGAGNWIIKRGEGEFHPCRADIFEATFDPAPEPPADDARGEV